MPVYGHLLPGIFFCDMKSLWYCLLMIPATTDPLPAQDLVTDRPDQTESSWVIPVGRFQVETGIVYEHEAPGAVDPAEQNRLGIATTLLRVGLSDRFELRVAGEYYHETIRRPCLSDSASFDCVDGTIESVGKGIAGIAVGAKIAVIEEDGWIPETSFLGHLTLPVGAESFRPSYIVPDFRFSMSHSLTDGVSFGYNLGGEWDDAGGAAGVYTATLGVDLSRSIGAYVELFGALPRGDRPEHSFDGGIVWGAWPNVQFDLAGGVGISDPAPDYYVSAGVAVRLPR